MDYTKMQGSYGTPVFLGSNEHNYTQKHITIVVTQGNLLFIKENMAALLSEMALFPVLEHVCIRLKNGTYAPTADAELAYIQDALDHWAATSAGAQKVLWCVGDVPYYHRVKIEKRWRMINFDRRKRNYGEGYTTATSKYWPVEI
jgi:hypothetical protein